MGRLPACPSPPPPHHILEDRARDAEERRSGSRRSRSPTSRSHRTSSESSRKSRTSSKGDHSKTDYPPSVPDTLKESTVDKRAWAERDATVDSQSGSTRSSHTVPTGTNLNDIAEEVEIPARADLQHDDSETTPDSSPLHEHTEEQQGQENPQLKDFTPTHRVSLEEVIESPLEASMHDTRDDTGTLSRDTCSLDSPPRCPRSVPQQEELRVDDIPLHIPRSITVPLSPQSAGHESRLSFDDHIETPEVYAESPQRSEDGRKSEGGEYPSDQEDKHTSHSSISSHKDRGKLRRRSSGEQAVVKREDALPMVITARPRTKTPRLRSQSSFPRNSFWWTLKNSFTTSIHPSTPRRYEKSGVKTRDCGVTLTSTQNRHRASDSRPSRKDHPKERRKQRKGETIVHVIDRSPVLTAPSRTHRQGAPVISPPSTESRSSPPSATQSIRGDAVKPVDDATRASTGSTRDIGVRGGGGTDTPQHTLKTHKSRKVTTTHLHTHHTHKRVRRSASVQSRHRRTEKVIYVEHIRPPPTRVPRIWGPFEWQETSFFSVESNGPLPSRPKQTSSSDGSQGTTGRSVNASARVNSDSSGKERLKGWIKERTEEQTGSVRYDVNGQRIDLEDTQSTNNEFQTVKQRHKKVQRDPKDRQSNTNDQDSTSSSRSQRLKGSASSSSSPSSKQKLQSTEIPTRRSTMPRTTKLGNSNMTSKFSGMLKKFCLIPEGGGSYESVHPSPLAERRKHPKQSTTTTQHTAKNASHRKARSDPEIPLQRPERGDFDEGKQKSKRGERDKGVRTKDKHKHEYVP